MTRDQQLATIYRHTHKDYKGNLNGQKTIMVLRNGGSCLVALNDLTDAEIERKMPSLKKRAKLSKSFLTIDGKRAGVWIDNGPWIDTVPAEQIVIRSKSGTFPEEFRAALAITNDSDMNEDYFEKDRIKMMPDHPLYEAAQKALA